MTFGQKMRELRETAGLTQDQLAEKADLNRNTIVSTETKAPGKFETVATILLALGFHSGSQEYFEVATLWFEVKTGINLGDQNLKTEFKKILERVGEKERSAITQLLNSLIARKTTEEEIYLLEWAVNHGRVLDMLKSTKEFLNDISFNYPLEVKENPKKYGKNP